MYYERKRAKNEQRIIKYLGGRSLIRYNKAIINFAINDLKIGIL